MGENDRAVLRLVERRQLYPELEPAAFTLVEGEISEILESPIGLHLMRCDEIFPGGMLPFSEMQEGISTHLLEMRRKKLQQDWIKSRLADRQRLFELAVV